MKKPPLLVLIDGDPIVYRCGFASQSTDYHYAVETSAGDIVCVKNIRNKNDMPFKMGEKGRIVLGGKRRMVTVVDRWTDIVGQPINNAVQALHTQMTSIRDNIAKEYGRQLDVRVLIGGSGNYREKIATIRPYKASRIGKPKPIHYEAIRTYLVEHYGAQVVCGRETDDELSILMRENPGAVVATIDKDLDQIPGLHYDYMKHVHHEVTPENAMLYFYQQVLSGDPTDDIPGAYKIGTMTAIKLVNEAWRGDEKDLWTACLRVYAACSAAPGYPYGAINTDALALETARLVKLQEYRDQLWNPPGIPDEKIDVDGTTEA